jgi:hypothetical protein
MKTKFFLFGILMCSMVSFLSCAKDNNTSSGTRIYYVINATYDNPQDHDGFIYGEVTHVALTMPSGSNSTSENILTPFTSSEKEYPSGMTVTATCESVLAHVTVTVEIWRNGVLWKNQTVLGSDNYTDVTVTGTLD